jgi:hypothetical protein
VRTLGIKRDASNSRDVVHRRDVGHSSKNDSKSMNANKSWIESNNRTTNRVGMPEKAGRHAKVVKPATAFRKANYTRDTINIKENRRSRDHQNQTA